MRTNPSSGFFLNLGLDFSQSQKGEHQLTKNACGAWVSNLVEKVLLKFCWQYESHCQLESCNGEYRMQESTLEETCRVYGVSQFFWDSYCPCLVWYYTAWQMTCVWPSYLLIPASLSRGRIVPIQGTLSLFLTTFCIWHSSLKKKRIANPTSWILFFIYFIKYVIKHLKGCARWYNSSDHIFWP